MKGVFVVIDGVADESLSVLGNKTPLEAAKTPHLDSLASLSTLHLCNTVKEGVAPESSSAILSLLGYNPMEVARGPLEALGSGVNFSRGDLVLRTNFATVDGISSRILLDRRAGRTLTTSEAQTLAKAINSQVKLPYKFHFYPTIQHRGVVVFKGGFSDNFSNVDPHYSGGSAKGSSDIVDFAKPGDDDESSKLSADLVNMFVRRSYEILDVHPLNITRAKKGFFSANFILCRDPGIEPPRLSKLRGKWMALTYMPLECGIARAAKMDVKSFSYPPLHRIDVYENLYAGLQMAVTNAARAISKNAGSYDYFFVHFKETDIPGHDNKPHDKVKMIEFIDNRFFSFLVPFAKKNKARVVVSADHTTSCRIKEHTPAPVPVLFYDPHDIKSMTHRYIESDATGKPILGQHLLDKTLFS